MYAETTKKSMETTWDKPLFVVIVKWKQGTMTTQFSMCQMKFLTLKSVCALFTP